MAERPIFIPAKDAPGFVKEISLAIHWASGFSPVQKKKNIKSLHDAAYMQGIFPILEVSTKSDEKAGQRLSAFYLKVETDIGETPLECAFQGSKVFENGGPYKDLYRMDAREAKRDPRLQKSGSLIRFEFDNKEFPIFPKTVFYDWLYLKSIHKHKTWLQERLTHRVKYAGFTDIEFNPAKSINCQARSCALFVSLMEVGILDAALASPESFISTMKEHSKVRRAEKSESEQLALSH